MVSGFLCGTGSLPREEDEYERQTRSADSSPRKCRSSKSSKNPYSTRGLDKFSALLAELEQKRQQIYTQLDPNEISMVRFVYSGDHDLKPIVVKSKSKPKPKDEPDKPKTEIDKLEPGHGAKLPSSPSMATAVKEENKAESSCKKKIGFYGKLKVRHWNEPRFYLPVIMTLILVLLVLFGRSFAIMCTSIGWYVIPTITNNGKNNSSNLRMSFKKKDYATIRRLSEKKQITSDGTMSFNSSLQENGHRKSI